MKKVFIMILTALCCFTVGGRRAQAQSIDDLNVVWSKTYGSGWIHGIKAQTDGSYLACGTGVNRLQGLVIEIDESGNEVRRLTATIPATYPDTIRTDRADLVFKAAFKTSDGCVLAFGEFMNIDAPYEHKQYDWNKGVTSNINDPAHFNLSAYLLNGVWIVKFNVAGEVIKNEFVRGRGITDAWPTNDGNFVVGGFDANATNNQNTSDIATNITLLRKYDDKGDMIRDLRADQREITSLYQYSDGSFLATTPDRMLRIDAAPNGIYDVVHYNNNSQLQGATENIYATSISPTSDGGAFISAHLKQEAGLETSYQTAVNGFALYKLKANNDYVYHKTIQPSDTLLSAPLLLPGADSIYVGTARVRTIDDVNKTVTDITDDPYKIYEWSDIGSTYAFRTGAAYPTGTTLMAVSSVDGFFSAGKNQDSGEAAIAKLSTCAKFKIDVGATTETYNGSGTFVLPARTITYKDNQETGLVDVEWELTDITTGGPAADLPTPSSGAGVNIPAQTVSLKPGKDLAMLRYTITAVDNYTTAGGVPQKCQQTSTILIRIYREYPDNVIKADCYTDPPTSVYSISEVLLNKAATIHNYGPLTAGDIDNDGTVEIIGFIEDSRSTNRYESNGIKIYYFDADAQQVKLEKQFNFEPLGGGAITTVATFGAMALARYNNTGYIVVAGTDFHVYAYDPDGNRLWESDTEFSHNNVNQMGAFVGITDFNGDGIPEVYVGNTVFSLVDGAQICTGGTSNNFGILSGSGCSTMAADIDGDGLPELCAGTQIYKVDVDAGTMTVMSELTQALPANAMQDGATQVADIDNDDKLEIIFISKASGGTPNVVCVWKPDVDGSYIMGSFTTPNSNWYSVPMIGNIDTDPYPEIVFIGSLMYALNFDPGQPAGSQISQQWYLTHTDGSACTGMSLFDFNQDGRNEIVYRDETRLRIINGDYSGSELPVENILTTFDNVKSGTLRELPLVVDIDNDKQADIVVQGDITSQSYLGYVRVFKTNGSDWAPARPVWNQYAYNAVNVNDDLTIPRYQMNPATLFPGKGGVFGDGNDIRPYNNFLQQQTTINQDGVPFWLAADAENAGPPRFHYYAGDDSMVVTVPIINTGDVELKAPFYVSVLKKLATDTTFIATGSSTKTVIPGDVDTVTVHIPDFSTYLPFDTLLVKLNSQDGLVYDQAECDTVDNRATFGAGDLLLARNDTVATVATIPVTIPVLKNDSIPAACRPLALEQDLVGALRGTVEVVVTGDSLRYTYVPADPALLSDPHFVDFDTITYRLACGTDTSTAKVYIVITAYPDNIIEADCYTTPPASVGGFRKIGETPDSCLVNSLGMVYAGDIDNDGHVEILALSKKRSDTYGYINETILYAFDDNLKLEYTIDLGAYANPISNPISIADVDGNGYAEIFVCTIDGTNTSASTAPEGGTLRKYSFNPVSRTFYSDGYKQHTNSTYANYAYCQPMITDFNGDGKPEVLVLDKVYNALDLTLLVDGEIKAAGGDLGYGAGHSTSANSTPTSRQTRMIAVGDIDNDGLPEVLAGSTAYKVTITNTTGETGNSFTVYKQANKTDRSEVGDGATVVADMDLDGYLDVIVSRRTHSNNNSANKGVLYIWNPRTGAIMNSTEINNLYLYRSTYGPCGPSVPFIGDIDGDKKPEVIVISNATTTGGTSSQGRITAYDFEVGKLGKLKEDGTFTEETPKWTKDNSDFSSATGITLFDFNQDGSGELVYRDETQLRILRGSDGADIANASWTCRSGTGIEYPIVVDYNNDGSAEILVIGRATSQSDDIYGAIHAYGNSGTKWAPARKVWNQYMYNVVNINDDLTVPRYQRNPATVFPNGTRPYNNFLQQQTSLDVEGNRIWLLPDVVLASGTLTVSGGTATVTLNIANQGDAALESPIYVSFYRNAISLDNHFKTVSVAKSINPGDTIRESFVFPDEVALNIIARVNDSVHVASNGVKTWVFPVRTECDDSDDYANNALRIPLPNSSGLITKKATLITAEGETFADNGEYANPVTVLLGDTIEYEITAVNLTGGDITVRDRLPPYIRYGRTMPSSSSLYTVTPPTIMSLGDQVELSWTLSGLNRAAEGKVTFRTGLTEGVNASQPLYVNQAQVEMPNPNGSGIVTVPTTSTYHQGGGASMVTFSSSFGGSVYNNEPQVVDYRASASEGVLVVPDEGYRFTGWIHDEYYSHRGKRIPAQSGILRYDSLTIQGNVDLRAEFAPDRYPIRYFLHEGVNDASNPPDYTVEDASITLAPPSKPGDVFTGWTGSNGDTPQEEVTIPIRSTGERVYYANYLYSGREAVASSAEEVGDNIWAVGNEAYIRTARAGSIVRVYTADGVLRRQHTILAPGLTKFRLAEGLYIITLNNGDGRKVVISD